MPNAAEFPAVFSQLKRILQPLETHLVVRANEPDNYYLDTRHISSNKKPFFFGAVQIKKNYVSYHLMPLYVYPTLLETLSDQLRRRMQGKSCFNFTTVDESMLAELRSLTQQGFEVFKQEGLLS